MRRLAALLLGLVAAGALLVTVAPPASAHAALLSTSPADGEIVPQSPQEVLLRFGEPVGTALGALRVFDAAGRRVDAGESSRTDAGATVHLPLQPRLARGSYVVVWRVVSADSHPVSGAFTFSIGAPTEGSASLLGRGNLTSIAAAPGGPGLLLGISRFVGLSALLVLLGGALFSWLVWPGGLPRLRPLLAAAAGVEAVAAVAALLLQGPYAAGLSTGRVFDRGLLTDVLDTQYGHATVVRVVLALLALALLRTRAWAVSLVAAGCALTWSLAGHAGTGDWQPATLVADLSHLLTVSAWVGGLVVLVLGLRRHWWDDAVVLPRWSRYATVAVAVLVVTGTFASVREVGTVGALFSTSYGVRLCIKVGLVGVMLLLALIGRSYVREHFPGPAPTAEETAGLRRSVSLETGTAVVIVALTALLVNTTPAKAAFSPPYAGRSSAGPLTVAVDLYPAKRGRNGLHVYTVGAGGLTRDVAEVTGTLHRGDQTLTVHLRHKSLGHYEDLNLVVPGKGTWTLDLQVRLDDTNSYPTEQRIIVH